MKLWTFQRKNIVNQLLKGNPIVPDFNNTSNITGLSLKAYKYIRDIYGECKGLIFGHMGNSRYETINTINELYEVIFEAGKPGGTYFFSSTHRLLELEIPESVEIMIIDFYRFTDLMFFYDEDNEDQQDIITSEKYLFTPNNNDGTWQLKIGHIPYILPEWIVSTHTPNDTF